MEAIIGAVAGGVMNCLCSRSVVDQCTYILTPTKDIATLRKKIADLNVRAADVSRRLDITESEEGKLRTNEVTSWSKDVENVNIEMNAIEDKVQRAKGCLKGLLPDCCLRSNLAHCISKLMVEVVALLEKGGHFLDNPLSLALPVLNKGIKIPTTRLVGKITAEKNMMNVWERLLDPCVGIIGLYGMGGAGKTTIMKAVNNRLLEDHHFDDAIWVTVSKDASIQNLQSHIANGLKIELSRNDDEVHRSAKLLESLERKKKFVLILDDMWGDFPLHVIGIPKPTKENGCKIIITSRSKEVCRRMGCHDDNIIKVKLLSEYEAWELFMDKVGIDLTPKVAEIAKNVVKECACLPLAIITIGGVMKGNSDISEWRVALRHLKESSYKITNMEDDVFKCLKFSYDRLPNEILKCCFLYCALYPEDYEIKTADLVDYWIVEGLIEENQRQYELDQGQVILNKLKDRCLLESESEDGIEVVKLHDLLREMALDISKDSFVVKARCSALEEIKNEEEWGENLERASFMESGEVTKMSVTPKCPKLSTLFLNGMNTLLSIPPDFFVHMKALKVLNLEGSREIEMLPASISNLENLRALCLSGCYLLNHIPSLAKLTLLRTLKLNNTRVKRLPHGMEMLVNLKCLDLSGLKLRVKFPSGLIPKWSLLEELCLFLPGGSSTRWKFYQVEGEIGFAEELLSLKHLEVLSFNFTCSSQFNSYVVSAAFKSLKKFHLGVGDESGGFNYSFWRRRNIIIGEIENLVNALIIPENTETLELQGYNNLMSLNQLSTRLNQLGCLQLRQCHISECKNMEYLLWFSQEEGEENEEGSVLQLLEVLVIDRCYKLERLCKGIPTPGSLLHLKELTIKFCTNIKNVFSSSRLLQLLQNLEKIGVWNCEQMEELIASSEEEDEKDITSLPTISLPKLKNLMLFGLPKLKSIWEGKMVCNSLEVVEIFQCVELKKLPQLSAPSLKVVKGSSQEWWDSLEWDEGDDDHASLGRLFEPLL